MPTPIRMRFQTISIMSSGWVVPGAELRDEIGRRNGEENLRMYQERESRTICTLGGRLRSRCFVKTGISRETYKEARHPATPFSAATLTTTSPSEDLARPSTE